MADRDGPRGGIANFVKRATADTNGEPAPSPLPSRWSAALFFVKRTILQIRRAVIDLRANLRRFSAKDADGSFPTTLAEHRSPLWTEAAPAEQRLQFGKVQNLRVALRRLNGIVLPANETFSFWKQVGPPTAARDFASGRELREGCLIPAIGGGICQLSNALYAAAIEAGAEIVERHAHSQTVPGSAAATGRDATVAFNYIDLRFRLRESVRIEARLTHDTLLVRFWGSGINKEQSLATSPPSGATRGRRLDLLLPEPNSCVRCGQDDCFRHQPEAESRSADRRTAVLVTRPTPEVETFLKAYDRVGDTLLTPLDGQRWKTGSYAFTTAGFSHVRATPLLTACQWLAARLNRYESPAARRKRRRHEVAALAFAYDRQLRPTETHLIVEQELLPALWERGTLGGRTFDVLLSQMPLGDLQDQLDRAASRWPESGTLGDFRVPPREVLAESAALDAARYLITAHPELVARYGKRAKMLQLALQPDSAVRETDKRSRNRGKFVVFPGPTVGRKGCYELRQALRELNLPVRLTGRNLEGRTFWQGIPRHTGVGEAEALADAAVVVQPSLWETRPPRLLLLALDAGIPVIATPGCGLGQRAGVTTVPFGDTAALIAALRACTEAVTIE